MVYATQIAAAKRLIAAKGQSVTWKSITDGAPADPTKPWKPSSSSTINYTVSIVFLPDGRVNREFIRQLNGTEIPKGRLIGLMAAVPFQPSLKDTVLRGSEVLTVEAIDPIMPNEEIIMYTVRFDR